MLIFFIKLLNLYFMADIYLNKTDSEVKLSYSVPLTDQTPPVCHQGIHYRYIGTIATPNTLCQKILLVFQLTITTLLTLGTLGALLCCSRFKHWATDKYVKLRDGAQIDRVYRPINAIPLPSSPPSTTPITPPLSLAPPAITAAAVPPLPSPPPTTPILEPLSSSDVIQFPDDHAKRVEEACAKALKILQAQDKDYPELNLPFTEVLPRVSLPHSTLITIHEETVFSLVAFYLAHMDVLQTFNWDSEDCVKCYVIEEAITGGGDPINRKPTCPVAIKFMHACLAQMHQNVRNNIADHLANRLFWKEYAPFAPWNEVMALIKIVQPYTNHTSIQQLFLAVCLDDETRLKRCLDAGTSPYNRIKKTHYNKRQIYSALDTAVIFDSPRCLELLLSQYRFAFPDRINFLWMKANSIAMYQCLLRHDVPLYDHLQEENVADHIFRRIPIEEWTPIFQKILDKAPKSLLLLQYSGKTLFDELYEETAKNPALLPYFDIAYKIYIGRLSGRLTISIVGAMSNRILLKKEKQWLPYLPVETRETYAKILDAPPTSPSGYHAKLISLKIELDQQMRLHNLDPDHMDMELILQACAFKKEVKKLLKTPDVLPAEEQKILKEAYDDFVTGYDRIVDKHPGFFILRFFSREIRKADDTRVTSLRVQRFMCLWQDVTHMEKHNSTNPKLCAENWRENSMLLRARVCSGHRQTMAIPIEARWIALMHGTSSHAIAVMQQIGFNLMSSGEVMRRACTLSGEGTAAVKGVNIASISTIPPEDTWDQQGLTLLRDRFSSRLDVARSYSCQTQQIGRSLGFDSSHEYTVVEKSCETLISGKLIEMDESIEARFWFDFKRALNRLKMTGNKEFMERSADLLAQLTAYHLTAFWKAQTPIRECLEVWQNPPKIEIDVRSPLMAQKIPALFASSRFCMAEEEKTGVAEPSPHNMDEILISAVIPIGPSTTSSGGASASARVPKFTFNKVFTSSEGVPVLSEALAKTGAIVQDFHAFSYQAMRQVSLRSGITPVSFETDAKITFEQTLLRFHHLVLPHYAEPFPKSTSDTGSYEGYISAVQSGKSLPRTIHGTMHSARVSFFSLMFMNMYAERGQKLEVEISAEMLLYVAGMHDSARQGEGVDLWDADSGRRMRYIAHRHLGITNLRILDCVEMAIAHKDSDNPEHRTVLRRCVQGGDCVDILRAIKNEESFQMHRLHFANDYPDQRGMLQDALREWNAFIQITESPALKIHMERHSQNFLKDLFLIFKALHSQGGGRFPITEKYLRAQCGQVSGVLDAAYEPFLS